MLRVLPALRVSWKGRSSVRLDGVLLSSIVESQADLRNQTIRAGRFLQGRFEERAGSSALHDER